MHTKAQTNQTATTTCSIEILPQSPSSLMIASRMPERSNPNINAKPFLTLPAYFVTTLFQFNFGTVLFFRAILNRRCSILTLPPEPSGQN